MSFIKNIAAFRNWYLVYAGRYGLLHKEIELVHRNGLRIRLRPDTDDLRIVKSNIVKKNYIRDFIPITKDSIVVDVGAHIGAFSVMVARFAQKVLAFEPEPNNYQMLKKNKELNHFENLSVFQMAVSGGSGNRDLFTFQEGSTSNYFLFKGDAEAFKIGSVPCISLEDIIQRERLPQIDFLKLDCEGAEHDILKNIEVKTANKIINIAMEVHPVPPQYSIDLTARLRELGFHVTVGPHNGYIYARQTQGIVR